MIFASWEDLTEDNEYIRVGKYFKTYRDYEKWCEKNDICIDECMLEEVDEEE